MKVKVDQGERTNNCIEHVIGALLKEGRDEGE